jgi:hypothetical protein
MPVADLHAALIKLQLDVFDLELKRVQGLPATDPDRLAHEERLIRQQFALKRRQALEKL